MKPRQVFFELKLLLLLLLFSGCIQTTNIETNPNWAKNSKIIKIRDNTIGKSGYSNWISEFSSDSQYFARLKTEGYNCVFEVWNLEGKQITEAIDKSKTIMTPEYRRKFNLTALREVPYQAITFPYEYIYMPYPDITKYTMGWYVSEEWNYAVTFTDPLYINIKKDDSKVYLANPSMTHSGKIIMQMWDIKEVPKIKWTKTIDRFCEPRKAFIYKENSRNYLLTNYFGEINIYDCEDSSLIMNFKIEIMPQYNKSKYYIIIQRVAYSPNSKLLACQSEGYDSFEVYSLDSKSFLKSVFSGDPSKKPKKNRLWHGDNISFAANGKFLIVSSSQDTRGIKSQHWTKIYDTSNWELIWQKESDDIKNIIISDNGQMASIERNGVFEIGTLDSLLKGTQKLK